VIIREFINDISARLSLQRPVLPNLFIIRAGLLILE
jgi:hypothetical protein